MSEEWVGYFSTIAGVTGAIFALLFVGMQVREKSWTSSRFRRYMTGFTLYELATPLFVSLIAIIPPAHRWWFGARVCGGLGLALIFGAVYVFAREKWKRDPPVDGSDYFQIVLTSMVSPVVFSWLFIASLDSKRGLVWIGWLCVWLVMSGVTESWVILNTSHKTSVKDSDITAPASPVVQSALDEAERAAN